MRYATIMMFLVLWSLCARAEQGFHAKYQRDYNIFDPINELRPDNPFNPINEVNPNNPLNPINRYNPNVPFAPLNDGRPDSRNRR